MISKNFMQYYQRYMMIMGTFGQMLYYFQAYQIWATCSCENVSFWGFFIALLSTASWAVYGFLLKDRVLAFAQTIGLIGCLWCIIMIKMYS